MSKALHSSETARDAKFKPFRKHGSSIRLAFVKRIQLVDLQVQTNHRVLSSRSLCFANGAIDRLCSREKETEWEGNTFENFTSLLNIWRKGELYKHARWSIKFVTRFAMARKFKRWFERNPYGPASRPEPSWVCVIFPRTSQASAAHRSPHVPRPSSLVPRPSSHAREAVRRSSDSKCKWLSRSRCTWVCRLPFPRVQYERNHQVRSICDDRRVGSFEYWKKKYHFVNAT